MFWSASFFSYIRPTKGYWILFFKRAQQWIFFYKDYQKLLQKFFMGGDEGYVNQKIIHYCNWLDQILSSFLFIEYNHMIFSMDVLLMLWIPAACHCSNNAFCCLQANKKNKKEEGRRGRSYFCLLNGFEILLIKTSDIQGCQDLTVMTTFSEKRSDVWYTIFDT